jgi:hypothetical protein
VLPAGDWVSEAEGTEFLITYAWRTEYHRTARGEDWISKLQINPALLDQGERGWVGWIDCPTHAALTRPIAKRLYQLTANAQARQAPLRFELAALRQLCGIASGSANVRTAHVRDDVLAAAEELVAHDVLSGAEVTSVARGRYVFHFEPGLRLRVAGWLRGVGTPDLTEQRVLRLLLASLDVAPKVAERMVEEQAGQVRQMLAYVFYQRDRGQAVRAPGRYVVDGVTQGWSYAGHDDFQRWQRERLAEARAGMPRLVAGGEPADVAARTQPTSVAAVPTAALTVAQTGVPAAHPEGELTSEALVAEGVNASAELTHWWEAAVAQAAPELHPLARAYLARARPALHSDVTALVVAHTDGEAARLARDAHLLADALARASDGRACEVLVLSPAQWRARQDDVRAQAQ